MASMPGVLLFFDISGDELMIILLVAFLVFGPSKIPEIARKIGRGMNEIRRASDEIKREISKEARKLETDTDGEGSPYKDIKQTADDLKKDLDDIARPLNESQPGNPGGQATAKPPKTDEMAG
jgi:TatA/E family protein of Tat protein translocase